MVGHRDQPSTSRGAYNGDGNANRTAVTVAPSDTANQSTSKRNHESIRAIVVTTNERSLPLPSAEFILKLGAHFEKFGGIHCLEELLNDAAASNGLSDEQNYLIIYRHA